MTSIRHVFTVTSTILGAGLLLACVTRNALPPTAGPVGLSAFDAFARGKPNLLIQHPDGVLTSLGTYTEDGLDLSGKAGSWILSVRVPDQGAGVILSDYVSLRGLQGLPSRTTAGTPSEVQNMLKTDLLALAGGEIRQWLDSTNVMDLIERSGAPEIRARTAVELRSLRFAMGRNGQPEWEAYFSRPTPRYDLFYTLDARTGEMVFQRECACQGRSPRYSP